MTSRLSEEDQHRVERYLSASQHQVERKPFRMWYLLGAIMGILALMSGVSLFLARSHGVI